MPGHSAHQLNGAGLFATFANNIALAAGSLAAFSVAALSLIASPRLLLLQLVRRVISTQQQ